MRCKSNNIFLGKKKRVHSKWKAFQIYFWWVHLWDLWDTPGYLWVACVLFVLNTGFLIDVNFLWANPLHRIKKKSGRQLQSNYKPLKLCKKKVVPGKVFVCRGVTISHSPLLISSFFIFIFYFFLWLSLSEFLGCGLMLNTAHCVFVICVL